VLHYFVLWVYSPCSDRITSQFLGLFRSQLNEIRCSIDHQDDRQDVGLGCVCPREEEDERIIRLIESSPAMRMEADTSRNGGTNKVTLKQRVCDSADTVIMVEPTWYAWIRLNKGVVGLDIV